MVTIAWCAFAVGAWILQQCAQLPSMVDGAAWLAAPLLLSAAAVGGIRHGASGPRVARLCRWLSVAALASSALAAGYDWAAWRAVRRLQSVLPLALEQQVLEVTGVVRGLPQAQSYGTRFVFQVSRYAWMRVPPARHRPAAKSDPDPASYPGPMQRLPADLSAGLPPQLPAHLPPQLLLTWYRDSRAGGAPLPHLQAGERWRFAVRLRRPHGTANEFGFDREQWLLERDLRATGTVQPLPVPCRLGLRGGFTPAALSDTVDRLRARLGLRIETVLAGAPHAGVVVALATGAQTAISLDDKARFTGTGTNHLVAISGLHVGIVAGLCAWLASRLWRVAARIGLALPLLWPAPYVGALSGLLAAAGYIALAGFGVPAQRAWWMLAAGAATVIGGRQGGAASALAWALGMIVLCDPWAVAAPGLALSFGSVSAVLLAVAGARRRRPALGPAGLELRLAVRLAARVRDGVVHALSLHGRVSVALVPLGALWFAQVPLVGIPANLLAIPWVSLLVTPLVLLGVVSPAPLDAWAYRLANLLIGWLSGYFDLLRLLPGALWHVAEPGPVEVALALTGVVWWLLPRGWPLRRYGLLLMTPLLWTHRALPAAGEFRLTVLDVGQGGATLIETAHHSMLFDAGPGPESSDAGARVVVPFLQAHGLGRLDLLMISHGDSDHAGGAAAVLGAIDVARLRASVPSGHRLWQQAAAAGLADQGLCRAGTRWVWDAVRFEVVWPDRAPDPDAPNLTACVLRVSNAAHAALLPADIEASSEHALVARMASQGASLKAELLLAPHHGSKTSSSTTFLDAIAPREVMFQVGYRNRFHHPSPSVVTRYRVRGVASFRSDADGEVRFETRHGMLDAAAYRVWHRRYWMGQ